MARFGIHNPSTTTPAHAAETTNKAGGVAYAITDPSLRLLHLVGTMFNEPTYYVDDPATDKGDGLSSEARALIDTATEVAKGPTPGDVLAVAAYARDALKMRQTPIILFAIAGECFPRNPAAKPGALRRYAARVLARADEPRAALAAWLAIKGAKPGTKKSVPNGLRRAIRDRLRDIPEGLLAKYDADVRPSMADAFRLCARDLIGTPKADWFVNRERWATKADETPVLKAKAALAACKTLDAEALALVDASHATWENVVSQFGSKPEVWTAVMPRMGYMALLRNLRNFLEAKVDVGPALAKIADPAEVAASRQLPFRFLSAADAIKDVHGLATQDAVNALGKALDASIAALPRLPGVTAVFVDNSGSMNNATTSGKSVMKVRAAANILGAIFAKSAERVTACVFADRVAPVPIMTGDTALTIARTLAAAINPTETNAHLCPGALRDAGIVVDRIVLLSDMQCWDSSGGVYGTDSASFRAAFMKYRAWAGRPVWMHSVNLAGTVEAQTAPGDDRVCLWSGFSERLVESVARAEGLAADAPAAARATATIDFVRATYGE